jgi:hypothetical protein
MCAQRVPDPGKVIRVGVLQDGKIVLEKRLDPGESLTVGHGPRATVPCAAAGRRHTLIEARRGRFTLRLPRGAEGKLSHEGQVLPVAELRARGQGGHVELELGEKSRGSIRIGELTLLFQLVQAPPIALRELQAPSFRPRLLADDDPVFMGFLGLFTVMASGFALYTTSIQPPELMASVEQMERFVEVILPAPKATEPDPIIPEPLGDDSAPQRSKADTEPEPVAAAAPEDTPAPEPSRPLTAQEAAVAEARAKEALREDVLANSRVLQILGSRGNSDNGYVDPTGAWGSGVDIPLGDEKLPDGSAELTTMWKQGGGSGTSREDVGIELGTATGGQASLDEAPAATPKPNIREPDALPQNSPDATKVHRAIRSYYPRVKACYERRLKEIPNLQGRVEVEWYVDGGRASDVWVRSNSTGDRELADCIAVSIETWSFPADVLDFPVKFPFVLYPG